MLFTRREHFSFRPSWLRRAANALVVGRIRSEDSHLSAARSRESIVRSPCGRFAGRMAVNRCGVRHVDRDDSLYSRSGRNSCRARRGHAGSHALDDARHLDRERAEAAAGHRPDIKQFPKSTACSGEGRAETPTDSAPLSMLETVITLKPPRVAQGGHVVLPLRPGVGGGRVRV